MSTVTKNARITGNGLGLTIGGTEYWADCLSARMEPGDAEPVTFGDVAGGVSGNWLLKATAIMSTATTALWSYIWANVGKEVEVVLAPHGNKQASAEQPHFGATARIASRPPIGTQVGESKGMTFDLEWPLTGEPELRKS